MMIDAAWDEYRGWARRARELQTAGTRWNIAAFVLAVLAAILGTVAGLFGSASMAGSITAFLAAATAAVTGLVGRNILDVKREAGWIQARSVAESIKSECYRCAARQGDYASAPAEELLAQRLDILTKPAIAAGLVAASDPVLGSDPRKPPADMTSEWYVQNRLRDQKSYYANRQRSNELVVGRLRTLALSITLAATIIGAAASNFMLNALAPWIAVLTTLGGLIVAYGFMERRQYLAATYGAMINRLARVDAGVTTGAPVQPIVGATEDALLSEQGAWTNWMTKHAANSPAGGGQ